MKKNSKIILCVVVVLAIVGSVVASMGFGNKSNKTNSKQVSKKSTKQVSHASNDTKSASTDNSSKNVSDVKQSKSGDAINVTITGKDTASYTELKALALTKANELKKANPDKKVSVKVMYKNTQIEDVNLGNQSNENSMYFETQPMYDPVLTCIRFKLHNSNNVSKVQVFLDGKEIKISDNQILKSKSDVFAVKSIDQNFKTGKIILQDKNGNKLESNF